MIDVPESASAIVLIQPHELGQVGLRQVTVSPDFYEVLVIAVRGVVAQVVRSRIDDRTVGFSIDDDELVVDVNGGRATSFGFPVVAPDSVLLELMSTALSSGKNPAGAS